MRLALWGAADPTLPPSLPAAIAVPVFPLSLPPSALPFSSLPPCFPIAPVPVPASTLPFVSPPAFPLGGSDVAPDGLTKGGLWPSRGFKAPGAVWKLPCGFFTLSELFLGFFFLFCFSFLVFLPFFSLFKPDLPVGFVSGLGFPPALIAPLPDAPFTAPLLGAPFTAPLPLSFLAPLPLILVFRFTFPFFAFLFFCAFVLCVTFLFDFLSLLAAVAAVAAAAALPPRLV